MSEVRLIDANALKEDFKSRLADCNEWIEKAKDKETKIRASAVKTFIGEVIMTIDNAPTVFSCNACKNMGNERECVDCHDYSNYVHYEERPQGKWIPVSEGLPDKNMSCLVSVGKFNITQIAMYSDLIGSRKPKIFYQNDYGKGGFQNITAIVNAWQPLPEPYKEGGAEK